MTIRRNSARWYETLAATLAARADKLAAENAAARAKLANTKPITLDEVWRQALESLRPVPGPVYDEDNLWLKFWRRQKYTK
jgi:hypothetical protein